MSSTMKPRSGMFEHGGVAPPPTRVVVKLTFIDFSEAEGRRSLARNKSAPELNVGRPSPVDPAFPCKRQVAQLAELTRLLHAAGERRVPDEYTALRGAVEDCVPPGVPMGVATSQFQDVKPETWARSGSAASAKEDSAMCPCPGIPSASVMSTVKKPPRALAVKARMDGTTPPTRLILRDSFIDIVDVDQRRALVRHASAPALKAHQASPDGVRTPCKRQADQLSVLTKMLHSPQGRRVRGERSDAGGAAENVSIGETCAQISGTDPHARRVFGSGAAANQQVAASQGHDEARFRSQRSAASAAAAHAAPSGVPPGQRHYSNQGHVQSVRSDDSDAAADMTPPYVVVEEAASQIVDGNAAADSGSGVAPGVASARVPNRRIRPCKAKRDQWREAIRRLEQEAARDPEGFDPMGVELPAGLRSNAEILERVRRSLLDVVERVRQDRASISHVDGMR